MKPWPRNPIIYEINTWIWLNELSRKHKRPVTFACVPTKVWDGLAALGCDAVWFMGVWERSPAGIAISNQNENNLNDFKKALPDFHKEDNVGSPYCVRQYIVDQHFGGQEGLAVARGELAKRGIRLMLDFVPNHVAHDHPWVSSHPEYFIQGNIEDVEKDPVSFVRLGDQVFACGRDPYFPAWQDVLQLNASYGSLRQAVIATLSDIARQCDGVRCDMAMLLLNHVFARTWGGRAGAQPEQGYWVEVISAIKDKYPDFIFMAEAYWGLEWELQQKGFDYCYDKCLYDRLDKDRAEGVRLHLCAEMAYQSRLTRFIENHDEPRALQIFPLDKQRAAAVTMATVPGAKLFHEGQFEGRKVRVPVFLARRPDEPVVRELQDFYRKLLKVCKHDAIRNGEWQLCERTGWSDNTSFQNLVAWCWCSPAGKLLILVNLSGGAAQGKVRLPWEDLRGKRCELTDHFSGQQYSHNGDEICGQGMFVDLPAWGYFVFEVK